MLVGQTYHDDDYDDQEDDVLPYGEVVCGNGDVIDMMKYEEFFWNSPRDNGGREYPNGVELSFFQNTLRFLSFNIKKYNPYPPSLSVLCKGAR